MVDKATSKFLSDANKKRKNKVGGFSNKEVLARAIEIRRQNAIKAKENKES